MTDPCRHESCSGDEGPAEVSAGTLTDFLLARIAEDEAVACGVRPNERLDVRDRRKLEPADVGIFRTVSAPSGRVLAECEAKREIVEMHKSGDAWCDHCSGWYGDDPAADCPTLRLLAFPYADHEHFRPEWRI